MHIRRRTVMGASLLAHFLIVLASLAGMTAAARADEPEAAIEWRVENSFRFFTDPSDTEVHRATFLALDPAQKRTPILSSERALQRRVEDGWASTMFRKTCWNDNRFRCKSYEDYINPKSHAIIAELKGIDDAGNVTCTWLTAPKGGEISRGDAVVQPCSEQARFVAPYPGALTVSVEIGGRTVASVEVKVRDVFIVGMGDSFASGEGNPDLPVRFSRERTADYSTTGLYNDLTGYPARVGPWRTLGDNAFIAENARWLDQACHRSLYSEQTRTALQLAIEDPHRAVTYVGVSCAGAEITFGLFLRYKGNEWVPNPPRLSQISAIAEAQCGSRDTTPMDLPEAYHINGQIPELKGGLVLRKCPQDDARKIDLVLVSIGGNDIGFSRLLANAVLSSESILRQLGGWLGEVHGEAEAADQLARLPARYKSLNRALHNLLYIPWNESDRIVLVAYPGLALEGDGSEVCKDGHAGMDAVPDFLLSSTKLRLGTWFADKLHRLMRDTAEENGWTFVETHRRAFIGRSICSGGDYDGGNPADDLRLPRLTNGVWIPYNPADFQAYASRQRWFRTPNDAFMTANFHVAAGLLAKTLKFQPWAPFQLVLASTYSGAFHPTAEGQAAIADAVTDKARAVLSKYGQGADFQLPVMTARPATPVEEPGVAIPDVKSQLTVPWTPDVEPNPAATPPAQPAATVNAPSDNAPPAVVTPPTAEGVEINVETNVESSGPPVEVTTPAPAVTSPEPAPSQLTPEPAATTAPQPSPGAPLPFAKPSQASGQ